MELKAVSGEEKLLLCIMKVRSANCTSKHKRRSYGMPNDVNSLAHTEWNCKYHSPSITGCKCIRVKHRLHKAQRAQSRERWRFAKQIRPELDCGKKAIQWEGAVRQALPNSLGYFVLLRACARRLYHITPAYFASTWLGDCIPRHVMMWSLDCRWYTASCFLPSSRLYIRMCR